MNKPTDSAVVAPAFDVVRVEPSGDTVIAGHAAPLASVELRDGGKGIAKISADDRGQFVIIPDPLSPGDHGLQLAARIGNDPEALSKLVPVTVAGARAQTKPQASPSAMTAKPAPGPVAIATPKPAPTAAVTPAPSATPVSVAVASKPAPAPKPTLAAAPVMSPTPAPVAAAIKPTTLPKPTSAVSPEPIVAVPAPAPPPIATPTFALVTAAAKPTPTPTAVAAAEPLAPPAVTAPPEPSPPPTHVGVGKVKTNELGGLEAEGLADPGAHLRLKLNGSFIAEVTANTEGRWSLSIERGLTTGLYALRAELLDGIGHADGFAESSFAYAERPSPAPLVKAEPPPTISPPPTLTPARPAEVVAFAAPPLPPIPPVPTQEPARPEAVTAPAPAPSPEPTKSAEIAIAAPAPPPAPTAATAPLTVTAPPASPVVALAPPRPIPQVAETPGPAPSVQPVVAADPSHAVVAEIRAATVVKGDNLWDLARHYYGDGLRYADIYHANANQIHNPNLIFVGQVFVVPQPESKIQ